MEDTSSRLNEVTITWMLNFINYFSDFQSVDKENFNELL